ncbi:MAG: putative sulfate/molybdate transporter [Nitrospirota bacterium]
MNVRSTFQSTGLKRLAWDISGAFGDIGVLLPLSIALIAQNGFNPTALFLMAGLFYIGPARYFKITMPVQPLKAMSAVAIASGMSYTMINTGGIIMGVILFFISITGLSVRLGNLFPVSVVRGIQLGLGLVLIKASFPLIGADVLTAFLAVFILLFSLYIVKSLPALIPMLVIAVIMVIKKSPALMFGPLPVTPALPDAESWWTAFNLLVLPQIALTFGNAIVATESAGKLLYGERAGKLNFRNIPMSMAAANIISGIMGGAPMCHGSGGLTAHNKFGASSERSGYIIGGTLIALALFFGSSVLAIVSAFPKGILGILLCYVGVQHSCFIKDILSDRMSVFIAVTVAMTGFLANNLTIGFLTGLVTHYSLSGILTAAGHSGKQ